MVPPKDLSHLCPFSRAKNCWEHIISLYKGSSSIQRSNFEVVLDEADEFVMLGDEDPRDLYRRVKMMTHKYRGSIVVLSISKSVEPNEEEKEMTSGFQ